MTGKQRRALLSTAIFLTPQMRELELWAMLDITHHCGRTAILLSELAAGADISEIVGIFLSNLPPKVGDLAEYLSANRLSELAQLAHQLKGAACGYGFPAISNAAERVEEHALDDSDEVRIRQAVDALKHLCEQAIAGGARFGEAVTDECTCRNNVGGLEKLPLHAV